MATPVNAIPVREIALVAVLAVAVYLLLSIGSYSPDDPAWTVAGSDREVTNQFGQSGAYTADAMLFAFGWSAYLLPAGLVGIAVMLLRHGWRDLVSWPGTLIRAGGFVLMLVATCLLAQLHFVVGDFPAGSGGALGSSLATHGLPLLNWVGLTVSAGALFAIGTQAAFGYSWLMIAEYTGRGVQLAGVGMLAGGRAALRLMRTVYRWAGERAMRRAERPSTPVAERSRDMPRREPLVQRRVEGERPRPEVKEPAVAPPASVQRRLFDMKTPREMPDLELLDDGLASATVGYSDASLEAMSRRLEKKLADFKVEAQVVSVLRGPVVTCFELKPAPGVKVSKITSLAKDLARSLAVVSVRIVEVIPGKSVVGIEIPNEERETVRLKELLSSSTYEDANSPLTLTLGKDIAGAPVMADIGKMPHLLVAGTTGSGKSVGVNAMLLSMLYKATPEELRLILVDPKMLELSVYDGIPHLLTPVVTDMKDAAQALNWCVAEMERRYQLMAALGVRNLGGYNRRIADGVDTAKPLVDPLWPPDAGEPAPPLTPLPYIVVVIDEFADMMMVVGKKVEQLIARIAQKARAAGTHLVLATQRPSVDVITGLIKANIPARIAFQVSSRVDSRTILDQGGGEQLLGHGDMLFLPPGTSTPVRVHGAFVSDEEVHKVAKDWRERGEPDYLADVVSAGGVDLAVPGTVDLAPAGESESEPLYDEAVAFVLESRRASISAVQRKLRIGYNRAARLIETMEEAGVVTPMNSNGSREVLPPAA